MADCCIIGCDNKAEKRGEIKFYVLPTARSSRPSKVKRRQLWLEAIEKANGTTEGLSRDDAQICSAHFVSGQMSLDISDQDFIPSVFPKEHTSKSRRQTLRPRSGVLAETPKVTPKKKVERKPANASEKVNESIFSPENTYCEPLEDEDALEEEETPQPPSSEVIIQQQEIIECVKLKKHKLQIKSIVDRFGQFRCEVCNGKFPTSSGLVKHKRLHEQEWSDEDETLPTESDFVVKSEFIVKPVSVEELSFQCNMCNRSFPTIHTLKRHKLLHVRDDRKCTQCGTMFCKRHNYVIAQPQISTETNFEEAEITVDDMNETAECPMLSLSLSDSDSSSDSSSDSNSDGDGVDEDLKLLLNSNSLTLDAIAAAQEQSEPSVDNLHKEAPAITYNPRKPGLLLAFKSFLTKHKNKQGQPIAVIPAMKVLEATATCTNTNTAHPVITAPITSTAGAFPITSTAGAFPITAPITTTAAAFPVTAPIKTTAAAFPITSTAAAFPVTAPITTTAATFPITTTAEAFPITAPIKTTAAAFPIIASYTTTAALPITAPITTTAAPITTAASAATIITASTSGITAKPVPETSRKTYALTTSTNALTPQNITPKPVIYVAKSPQQTPGLPLKKMEQSTVCLSFSKPLPTNVIQEFMTYISKNESMKSQTPRLVTFTAKQDQVITKQEPDEIASIIKLEQSQTPIQVPILPEEPNKEKQTFIITTLRKPNLQTPPKMSLKLNLASSPQILPKLNLQTTPQILKPHDQKLQKPKQTLNPKKFKPSPTVQAPCKRRYVHESRPPLPEPIFAKIKKSSWHLPVPNYPKDFVQPHLPHTPKLPPALQMFSPQFLTSAMLDVERNFEYILSDTFDVKT